MKVLIPIANGIEEMEAIILQDTLVRAGMEVTMSSIHSFKLIKASRGALIQAHELLSESSSKEWDLILLPGGLPGAQAFSKDQVLENLLKYHANSNKFYGAICASPANVLKPWNLLPEGENTGHPNFKKELGNWSDQAVILNRKCFTSQGPGSAFHMALYIIERMVGLDMRSKVEEPLCIKPV